MTSKTITQIQRRRRRFIIVAAGIALYIVVHVVLGLKVAGVSTGYLPEVVAILVVFMLVWVAVMAYRQSPERFYTLSVWRRKRYHQLIQQVFTQASHRLDDIEFVALRPRSNYSQTVEQRVRQWQADYDDFARAVEQLQEHPQTLEEVHAFAEALSVSKHSLLAEEQALLKGQRLNPKEYPSHQFLSKAVQQVAHLADVTADRHLMKRLETWTGELERISGQLDLDEVFASYDALARDIETISTPAYLRASVLHPEVEYPALAYVGESRSLDRASEISIDPQHIVRMSKVDLSLGAQHLQPEQLKNLGQASFTLRIKPEHAIAVALTSLIVGMVAGLTQILGGLAWIQWPVSVMFLRVAVTVFIVGWYIAARCWKRKPDPLFAANEKERTRLIHGLEALELKVVKVSQSYPDYDLAARWNRWNKEFMQLLRSKHRRATTEKLSDISWYLMGQAEQSLLRADQILGAQRDWIRTWSKDIEAVYQTKTGANILFGRRLVKVTEQLAGGKITALEAMKRVDEIVAQDQDSGPSAVRMVGEFDLKKVCKPRGDLADTLRQSLEPRLRLPGISWAAAWLSRTPVGPVLAFLVTFLVLFALGMAILS